MFLLEFRPTHPLGVTAGANGAEAPPHPPSPQQRAAQQRRDPPLTVAAAARPPALRGPTDPLAPSAPATTLRPRVLGLPSRDSQGFAGPLPWHPLAPPQGPKAPRPPRIPATARRHKAASTRQQAPLGPLWTPATAPPLPGRADPCQGAGKATAPRLAPKAPGAKFYDAQSHSRGRCPYVGAPLVEAGVTPLPKPPQPEPSQPPRPETTRGTPP